MFEVREFLLSRSLRPVRYLAVGGLLFLVDLTIVVVLVSWAGLHPAAAQLVGRASGATLGFLLHRSITFQGRGDSMRFGIASQGAGYTLVAIVMFVLSPFVLLAALRVTGGHLIAAKILAEVVLVAMTYVCLRFVFQGRGRSDGQP